MNESYEFAKNTGDTKFLRSIRNRLINVYHESPYVDFLLTLDDFIEGVTALVEERNELKDEVNNLEDELSDLRQRISDLAHY